MATKVKTLDRKRKDYLYSDRRLYEALCEGGYRIKSFRQQILPRRPAESDDVYKVRIEGFHYLNRVAKVVDEFAGSVFGGELQVHLAKEREDQQRPPIPEDYAAFLEDPKGNRDGSLEDVLYEAFVQSQIHRDYFFMPVFQDAHGARDRAEQERAGALKPALRCLDADTVINFSRDEHGIAWVMLKLRICDDEPLKDDDDRRDTIRWTLIDRKTIRVWETEVKPGVDPPADEEVDEQPPKAHRWATAEGGRGICPIVQICLERSTWLVDKIASIALEETRKRNGLSWLEDLAAYPLPYHAGDSTLRDKAESAGQSGTNTRRGAAYWFEIDKGDELGYLEPSGGAFDHLARRLETMGHELAEVVHQAASALGPKAAAQVQSAASKLRDSVAKRLLAETYASDIRKAVLEIMRLVSVARGENLAWEVLGLEVHDTADSDALMNEGLKVQGIRIPSETFQREYLKRLALGLLPSASPETRDAIGMEIDKAEVLPNEGDRQTGDNDEG